MVYTLRTRFKKEIISEFLQPTRRDTGKVIIFCAGMPSMPSKKSLLEFYAKKGFWVFYPRYRGTWESGGKFLAKSPHQDILDIVDELPKGFTEFFDGKRFRIKPKKVYIFGSSFGGAAALLASRDGRVTKVVASSPIIDWSVESKSEPLPWLEKFTRNAFGEAYRVRASDWKKLGRGSFYNPASYVDEIDGEKVLLFHAKDDDVVPYGPTVKFAKITGAKLILSRRGGHGVVDFTKSAIYKKIKKFLAE